MKKILMDTRFWMAFFNPRELNRHHEAPALETNLRQHRCLLPWPTLYEFMNTRLTRRPLDWYAFTTFLQQPNVELVDDLPFRSSELFDPINLQQHSLVDQVLNQMLWQMGGQIDFLYTFNRRDFQSVCSRRNVTILPG